MEVTEFLEALKLIASEQVIEKALRLPVLWVHSKNDVYLFVVKGDSGNHGVEIFPDGRAICSCQFWLYRKPGACSHIVRAVIWVANEYGTGVAKALIKKMLFGGENVRVIDSQGNK